MLRLRASASAVLFKTMYLVHLSTFDRLGGAAKAAHRIHTSLKKVGIHSQMIVEGKAGDEPSVITLPGGPWGSLIQFLAQKINRLPLGLYPGRERVQWSVNCVPNTVGRGLAATNHDIVHIHWVGDGFVPIRAISGFGAPIVWTLHDFWPMTGGCHLPGTCQRYKESCGCCPQLGSNRERDITRFVWEQKQRHWQATDMTLAATSGWVAECARSSSLFRQRHIEVIPLGLDLNVFKPIDKAWARTVLNWPQDKHIILMGAFGLTSDRGKGFHHMVEAADILAGRGRSERMELVLFGQSGPDVATATALKTRHLGRLLDEVSLALVYAAADVFVCPSKEECFGQTVLEAMACGTPCVAFGVGALPELVENGVTGYLARPQDAEDLALGIEWVLADPARHRGLSLASRAKVERQFSAERAAQRYKELYTSLLKGS